MAHPKKTQAGKQERLDILLGWETRSEEVLERALTQYKRRDVQLDDVLDALAALVTGRAEEPCPRSLPDHPEFDDQGLPMRMVYCDATPLCNGDTAHG